MAVIGKIGLTPKGEYNPETVYEILDVVSHEGNSYISKIQNNEADVTNTEAWLLAAKKGEDGLSIKGDKGDTFTFNDLTAEQKEELKGDVIAYNSLSDADKLDLASRVPTAGVIEEGNTQAVSGGRVWEYIEPINLKLKALSFFQSELYNPLNQYLEIKLEGDSKTWGMTASGIAPIEPRDGTLTDTRNNSSSKSWANLLHNYIGGSVFGSGYNYTESLTDGAQGGVNIFSYKKDINLLPNITNDINFKVYNNATTSLKGVWSSTYNEGAFSKGFITFTVLYSTDQGRIDFKFTGNQFQIRYAAIEDGARYELFVNEISQGIFSTQTGDTGNSGFGFIHNHTFDYVKDADVSIRAISGDTNRILLRIENIIIPREIKIVNQGIIGTTSSRYINFLPNVLSEKTNIAIIQLGTNDRLSQANVINSINEFEKNIQIIVEYHINNGTIPILMCANAVVTESFAFTMGDVRNSLKNIAEKYNLIFIDNYKITYGKLSTLPYPLADGLHPNDVGHELLFNNIKNILFE